MCRSDENWQFSWLRDPGRNWWRCWYWDDGLIPKEITLLIARASQKPVKSDFQKLSKFQPYRTGPNVMALRAATPLTVQAPHFCASCVCEECLVNLWNWCTHAHKQTIPAYTWNTLDVSAEFHASVSVDSLLTVSRAIIGNLSEQAGEVKPNTSLPKSSNSWHKQSSWL